MKKFLLLMMAMVMAFSVGCAKQYKAETAPPAPVAAAPADMCIPEWETNPPSASDGFYASGQAQLKLAALSRETADSRAMREIGRQVESKTDSMLKDFMQQSGFGDDASVLEYVQSVSKSVSSQVLRGARVTKRQFCPDGTVHSLAFYPAASYKKEVKKDVKTEAIKKNLYDDFKANKAFEELDSQVDELLQ